MKILLVLIFLLSYIAVSATDYYISTSGNDTNTGLSTSTPWKTIAKVNSAFANMKPGDQILFNRGDTFYGSLVISKSGTSGSPITLGAYGAGEKPIITGFTTVTSWIHLGNNIWESTNTVSKLTTCNMVTINNVNTPMGRYPKANAANGGYLTIQSHSGNTSITSSDLTGAPDWTGAEVVVRVNRFTINKSKIASQKGSSLVLGTATIYEPGDGFGFFIQNDSRILTSQGEWCYIPSTHKIRVYSTGQPLNVKVASIERLITPNANYLNFENISFTGANEFAFYNWDNTPRYNHININNNTFSSMGIGAIYTLTNYLDIENNIITDSNCGAISVSYGSHNNIKNNTVQNIGAFPGMRTSSYYGTNSAVESGDSPKLSLENNRIINTGYCGISFYGDSILVKNNFIDTFCTVLDDGGGIYTYTGIRTPLKDGKINGNIVINGVGNPYGEVGECIAAGIYLDERSKNIEVLNNSISDVREAGIVLNTPVGNINVHNNTIVNASTYQYYSTYWGTGEFPTGNRVISNIFVAKYKYNQLYTPSDANQKCLSFWLSNPPGNNDDAISLINASTTLDSNYYARPVSDDKTIRISPMEYYTQFKTLAEWQIISGQDANSHISPVTIIDAEDILFFYNETAVNKPITLSKPMIDVKGVKYANSIELLPFTSLVLLVDPNPDLPILPIFVNAKVENAAPSLIEMTYNLSLANIAPATSAFSVLVNSAAIAVNSVVISGMNVQLTLASAIAYGDVITVTYTKPAVSPLQTTSAGLAASVTAQAVTNNISAPVPVYISASVGNTAPSLVEMTYDLSLANIVPATSAFSVLVNSAARAVNAVAISGTKVQLTLASAIAFGDVVTVAYSKPVLSPLQTSSAGQAVSVAAKAVTNNVSAPIPVYASAAVGNTAPSLVEMTYNLSLANIVPATSAFSVLVNSAARAVNAVAISGTKVQLTLASTIAFGDVVTVAYTKPAVSPLQTTSAGLAASVTAQVVTNNISAPVPVYVSAAVGNTTPLLVEMTYNVSLANIVPVVSAFAVQVNSIARTVNTAAVSGTKVQLTLSGPVLFGDVVTVAYTKPLTNGIQNSYGGQAVSITSKNVTNNVVRLIPAYVSSVIENSNPSLLKMTYNLSLAIKRPGVSAFSVKVNSAIKRVKSVNISGNKVLLTLANPVVYGDVITVAYTKPSTNPLQTTSAVLAVSISSQPVTNNCLKMILKNITPILALTNDTVIYSETVGNFKTLDISVLEKRKITIYPNPAYAFFKISIDEPTVEPQILKIIDLSGKVVLTEFIEQGLQNIQIPVNFKAGNYIVTVESNNKIHFTQKLIILQLQ